MLLSLNPIKKNIADSNFEIFALYVFSEKNYLGISEF